MKEKAQSDLKLMETLIVSCDQVAADSFGSGLLGLSKVELPHIIKAEMAGVGTSDYHSLKPIFVNSS